MDHNKKRTRNLSNGRVKTIKIMLSADEVYLVIQQCSPICLNLRLVCTTWRDTIDSVIVPSFVRSYSTYTNALKIDTRTLVGQLKFMSDMTLKIRLSKTRYVYVDTSKYKAGQCIAFTRLGFQCKRKYTKCTLLCNTHHYSIPGIMSTQAI